MDRKAETEMERPLMRLAWEPKSKLMSLDLDLEFKFITKEIRSCQRI